MILFLTFNDTLSGIYQSQVIDVCRFINQEFAIKVKLVAFISLRNFFRERARIKNTYNSSIVFPMFPGVTNWKKNYFLLSFLRSDMIIARGPFATWLSLVAKRKGKTGMVCFDARGAYTAEFNEYDVSRKASMNKMMHQLEMNVVLSSDFRIAVSEELVRYWKQQFDYNTNGHVVIPCTVSSAFLNEFNSDVISRARKEIGFSDGDLVIAYSGSGAAWQSLDSTKRLLEQIMESDKRVKILLMTSSPSRFSSKYDSRVVKKNVTPDKVRNLLVAADYGILVREDSVTNKVSSPVKFAEYLACGLPVIISNNIGDYPLFVKQHKAGIVFSEIGNLQLEKVSMAEKTRLNRLALFRFTKEAYRDAYEKIVHNSPAQPS